MSPVSGPSSETNDILFGEGRCTSVFKTSKKKQRKGISVRVDYDGDSY